MTQAERYDRVARHFPAVMLVTDSAHLRGRDLPAVVDAAVGGGASIVQLREKTLSRVELIELGQALRDVIAGRALLFVNGDARAAVACGADGVHLPEDAPQLDDTQGAFEGLLLSRAAHSVDAARRAEEEGADLIVLGTMFPSASHPGGATIGVSGVREACEAVRVPVIGIGGVTAGNAGDVVRAGAAGVAVIGAIMDAEDARAAAAELRRAVEAAWRER